MANTYIPIQTVTVGSSGSATIAFTSIPATYTDLVLLLSLRTTGTGSAYGSIGQITLNSTTSGYTVRDAYGFGSGGAGGGGFSFATTYIPTGRDCNANHTASTFSNQLVYITNYTSTANKAISVDAVNENNNATNMVTASLSALSTVTTAINAITITSGDGNYVEYSSATLYGINKS
jgi:hypothetical protein